MKNISFVLVAAFSLAAVGCKKKGTGGGADCAQAINHSMELSKAEMQKMGSGVSESVSHYQVFQQRLGFRWFNANRYVYEVKGISGRKFAFDLDAGTLVEETTEPSPAGDVLKAAPEE